MNAHTVLMCGGPADGRWVVVEPGTRYWQCVRMPRGQERWTPGPIDPQGPGPERVEYDVRPIMILGHELWVGIAVDEAYDDRAVMRAIMQRDVAAHLGAYK